MVKDNHKKIKELLKNVPYIEKNIKTLKRQRRDLDIEIDENESAIMRLEHNKTLNEKTWEFEMHMFDINKKLKLEKIIDLQIDELDEISESLNEKIINFNKIKNALKTLTDKEQKIIKYKYFEKLTWFEVSHKMNLSSSRSRAINDEALIKLEPLINELEQA